MTLAGLLVRIFLGMPHRLWSLTRRHPLGVLAILVLIALAIAAAFPGLVATRDPLAQDIPHRLSAPSGDFLFGTDTFGRDTFSRVIHGARVSLYVGFASLAIALLGGTIIGVASGYIGGLLDLLLQRFVDTLLAFPSIVLALVLVAAVGGSQHTVIAAIAITLTPQIARLARAQTLALPGSMHIKAARVMGAGAPRIMFRHILPHTLGPLTVHATGLLEGAIVLEAALSFLGLSVPPPQPSWGRMLREGSGGYLESAPWLTLFPGLAITVAVFAIALIGDSLRDLLDPRLPPLASTNPSTHRR